MAYKDNINKLAGVTHD